MSDSGRLNRDQVDVEECTGILVVAIQVMVGINHFIHLCTLGFISGTARNMRIAIRRSPCCDIGAFFMSTTMLKILA